MSNPVWRKLNREISFNTKAAYLALSLISTIELDKEPV